MFLDPRLVNARVAQFLPCFPIGVQIAKNKGEPYRLLAKPCKTVILSRGVFENHGFISRAVYNGDRPPSILRPTRGRGTLDLS